jgi:hypothetical protein
MHLLASSSREIIAHHPHELIMDVAKYTNSRKIYVRFNHWKVKPIVDRVCVNMDGMLGRTAWSFQDSSDPQNSKHLRGRLSLSTASSPKSEHPDNDTENHENALVQSMEVDQFENLDTPTTSLSVGSCNYEQVKPSDSTEAAGRDPCDEPSGTSHGSEPTISLDSNASMSDSESAVCRKLDTSGSVGAKWQRSNGSHPAPITQQNDLKKVEVRPVQVHELCMKGLIIDSIDTIPLPNMTQNMPNMLSTHAASIQRDCGGSGDANQNPYAKRRSSNRVAIHSQDIMMLRWRDAGHDWPWVLEQRQRHGFDRKAAQSLSNRLTQVKYALQHSGLSDNIPLLDKVASGDVEAKQILNALVKASRRSKDLAIKKERPPITSMKSGEIPVLFDAGKVSRTAVHKISDSLSETEHGSNARATSGGKTIFADINDLESVASNTENDEDNLCHRLVRREESPEPSGLCPEDFCHYAFQVLRREHYSADAETAEEALQAGDSAWSLCGTYDNLCESNNAVIHESMRQDVGGRGFATAQGRWTLDHATGEDGELICTVFKKGMGALCVQTKRYLRTFYDGILPKSKTGWLSRNVYTVHKQTTRVQAATDDLFGEETERCYEDEMVDNAVFTSLRMANERAVDVFVKSTIQHATTKIDDVLAGITQSKRRLSDEFDMDTELFDHELGSKRVCVRKRELRGPRNL